MPDMPEHRLCPCGGYSPTARAGQKQTPMPFLDDNNKQHKKKKRKKDQKKRHKKRQDVVNGTPKTAAYSPLFRGTLNFEHAMPLSQPR
jgi:hypothetical protein